jgi:hypothetical protein
MRGFRPVQCGRAGWITAGGPNEQHIDYPYIEWYSTVNDRVVLMPEPAQVRISEAREHVLPVYETAK